MRESSLSYVVCALLFCLLPLVTTAQQGLATQEVPENFNLDLKTAARLRPELLAQSTAAAGRYATGRAVFQKLTEQVQAPRGVKRLSASSSNWELRIVGDDLLNAFSSPDGTVYVESGLADLAGKSPGMWAAILSHEIAHVVRRDWARRYLYEASLHGGGAIVLGDPAFAASSWSDTSRASEDLARFCRQLELGADLDGLMLMAHAGFHPDFVPALHHLLHAQSGGKSAPSIFAMHPCWDERDRELERAYVVASIEFERRWPDWYATPGGNPPTLVFADQPSVKKMHTREWEIRLPMRCQNLVGAVEVVLATHTAAAVSRMHASGNASGDEARQLTGCTSPKTTITFTVPEDLQKELWAEVFVLDGQGEVLSRAAIPKLNP